MDDEVRGQVAGEDQCEAIGERGRSPGFDLLRVAASSNTSVERTLGVTIPFPTLAAPVPMNAFRLTLLTIALMLSGCAMTNTGVTPFGDGVSGRSQNDTTIVYAQARDDEGGIISLNKIDGAGACAWVPCLQVFRLTPGTHRFYIIYTNYHINRSGDTEIEVPDMKAGHVYQLKPFQSGPREFQVRVVDHGKNVEEIDLRDPRFKESTVRLSFSAK